MGRIFETRKHKMFARYAKMARQFTRIGKEIAMACKTGGSNPDLNPRLRMVMQNAKSINMPKHNIDAAIKRATDKDTSDYEEIIYEGYGPGGVAVLIETATDNTNRTVASVRMYFNKYGGTLGKTGSLDFIFDRKGIFEIDPAGKNVEDLELELIDFGLEEIEQAEGKTFVYVPFNEFGNMQKGLEDLGIVVVSAEKERIPNTYVDNISAEQKEDFLKMVDKLEDDEDVQSVYHNLKEDE